MGSRWNKRRGRQADSNQGEIVKALEAAYIQVWEIGEPVDLLTFYRGHWLPLEIKRENFKRARKDQERQNAFIAQTGCPVVKTALEAIAAVTGRHSREIQ